MFDWLFEGYWLVYALLGLVVFALLALWARDRKNSWLLGAGIALVLMGVYLLLDFAVETDREQITARVKAIARAVEHKDLKGLMEHVSDKYDGWPGTKAGAEAMAKTYLERDPELPVWDFRFEKPVDPTKEYDGLTFGIKFRARSGQQFETLPMQCKPTFVKDPVKGWQLKRVTLSGPDGVITPPAAPP